MPLSERFHACILQPPLRAPDETPAQATEAVIKLMKEAAQSSESKTDLFLLPELCPIGYSEDTFAKLLPTAAASSEEGDNKKHTNNNSRDIYRQIDLRLQETARELDCAICYGTVGWNSDTSDTKRFIRQLVVDDTGSRIASYDKIHVCNYGDCNETRFFTPGSKAVSFSYRGWKFGILICADMRYPILAQRLVKDHGVDVLLQPACFARDVSFRTWKSFRETRAVENGVYFLAGNYAGDNFGEASVVPPWVDEDHEPMVLDNRVGYLSAVLDRKVLQQARTELPFYKHLCQTPCCDY
eukprot:CAMPEP_0117017554 /NCGR_PEP_ID=MMETSP0472-20121206/13688_1 /TAXON_ID=693140 ORGANISM="Tiarina fusus, Strain LIS" /NCGR_SAMPLE_ID=MMETSP0472 /ASSEMBLY_ACC=CAM_ASM_000603 /LENGTH=297 /DNA_ID=CAMNT_0004721947 /DNA_START=99 /DNA_END=992 /DNA_ORIENTATION=+